ncbi:MAG: pyridoxal-phosphate dependent enzyme [Planctomycetes bacterium]|nr:pyridoxal-phosphate dependent enzyme [Planctomycetota bacterium]
MHPHDLPTEGRYLQAIGPTPLVAVRLGQGPQVHVNLELLNPSGSIKDRIARYILEKAWRRGDVRDGREVVEASSGSTSMERYFSTEFFGPGGAGASAGPPAATLR